MAFMKHFSRLDSENKTQIATLSIFSFYVSKRICLSETLYRKSTSSYSSDASMRECGRLGHTQNNCRFNKGCTLCGDHSCNSTQKDKCPKGIEETEIAKFRP